MEKPKSPTSSSLLLPDSPAFVCTVSPVTAKLAPMNPVGLLGLTTLFSCWPVASCADPVRMVKSGKTPLVKQGVALMAENAKILNTLTTGEAEMPCTLCAALTTDARTQRKCKGQTQLIRAPLTAPVLCSLSASNVSLCVSASCPPPPLPIACCDCSPCAV